MAQLVGFKRWVAMGVTVFVALAAAAAFVWRDDILRTALDPKQPFQTYRPPPAPDYTRPEAWVLRPMEPKPAQAADVFFVHPTTYDGGHDWNGPIDSEQADHTLQRVALPNYAGPFARIGRVFAPRYRQGSLYTQISLREDAKEARKFAYGDIAAAFDTWRARHGAERPFVLVGVEQGGFLAARLLTDRIAADPALKARLVGAYLIRTVVPAETFGTSTPLPACAERRQAGCVVAWAEAFEGDDQGAENVLAKGLVWTSNGEVELIGENPALCVNPLTGGTARSAATPRDNLGAVNATGLEWGARPAFSRGQVGATCSAGLLKVTRPSSPSFRPAGSWADRSKVPGYNLFYADLEADALARLGAWRSAR